MNQSLSESTPLAFRHIGLQILMNIGARLILSPVPNTSKKKSEPAALNVSCNVVVWSGSRARITNYLLQLLHFQSSMIQSLNDSMIQSLNAYGCFVFISLPASYPLAASLPVIFWYIASGREGVRLKIHKYFREGSPTTAYS